MSIHRCIYVYMYVYVQLTTKTYIYACMYECLDTTVAVQTYTCVASPCTSLSPSEDELTAVESSVCFLCLFFCLSVPLLSLSRGERQQQSVSSTVIPPLLVCLGVCFGCLYTSELRLRRPSGPRVFVCLIIILGVYVQLGLLCVSGVCCFL